MQVSLVRLRRMLAPEADARGGGERDRERRGVKDGEAEEERGTGKDVAGEDKNRYEHVVWG